MRCDWAKFPPMANPTVTFETSLGNFTAELFVDQMPITAGHILDLCKTGFYNGLHFHRVIEGFMLQFGCPHSKDPSSPRAGTGDSPKGKIQDEHTAKLTNAPGTLSMANTGQPNTNGSQFFICHADAGLPHSYNIFGQVTSGMDAVDAIATTPTGAQDRPHDDCVINSVTITES